LSHLRCENEINFTRSKKSIIPRMAKNILVTGGAGYIGSHTALQIVESGQNLVVLDNLYSGNKWAIPKEATFYFGSILDRVLLKEILEKEKIDAVVHFAGHIVVPESVDNPGKYYQNNVIGSLNLIETCVEMNVNEFVFSSSAAVYGIPKSSPVNEDMDKNPINPYGATKLITEWTLRDLSGGQDSNLKYVALRYFNVAGAHMGGLVGQSTPEATHLIKVACQVACGLREEMSIFGDDYDTADGTCIRDYIHVDDLATAHINALSYLDEGGESCQLNCGYGEGYSVKDVIECVRNVSGINLAAKIAPRREGDPPELISDCSKIMRVFDWKPKYNDLETICRSAYEWEKKLSHKRPD
jgi:UDP-glucose 4-epimerase